MSPRVRWGVVLLLVAVAAFYGLVAARHAVADGSFDLTFAILAILPAIGFGMAAIGVARGRRWGADLAAAIGLATTVISLALGGLALLGFALCNDCTTADAPGYLGWFAAALLLSFAAAVTGLAVRARDPAYDHQSPPTSWGDQSTGGRNPPEAAMAPAALAGIICGLLVLQQIVAWLTGQHAGR